MEFIKNKMKKKAIIISIRGTKLSKFEKKILREENPWGIILFKRNLKSFIQIKQLTNQIKILSKKSIINHNFNSTYFGYLFKADRNFCIKIYKQYIDSLSKILLELGININTIPVLDVLRNSTNKVIGKRSFSKDKKIVKILGKLTVNYLHNNKIAAVIKHIPGHGVSTKDSHLVTPKVEMNLKKLNNIDFYPFKSSKAKLAMTAHILYKKLDKINVATFSKKIIKNIIRKKIKFNGIIISDDISMKALKYDLVKNAFKSLEAGCNLVLYCAGKSAENRKLLKSIPYIDDFTSKKTSEFYKFLR